MPLTPRVAAAASFEHLITDNFRSDTPRFLPEPWGYAKEETEGDQDQSGMSFGIETETSRLMDNSDYFDSMLNWEEV